MFSGCTMVSVLEARSLEALHSSLPEMTKELFNKMLFECRASGTKPKGHTKSLVRELMEFKRQAIILFTRVNT